jgi:phosphoribosylaminoimidazole (AIR) synthetase
MSTYKESGVDIDAGDRAVELMKASIAKATRPEVMGGIGGFAGLFDASALKKLNKPLLATSTDGVGTKTEIARQMGIYDTIGEDLVAMVVDDLVVCGAEPLFMTDYIAVGYSSVSATDGKILKFDFDGSSHFDFDAVVGNLFDFLIGQPNPFAFWRGGVKRLMLPRFNAVFVDAD